MRCLKLLYEKYENKKELCRFATRNFKKLKAYEEDREVLGAIRLYSNKYKL